MNSIIVAARKHRRSETAGFFTERRRSLGASGSGGSYETQRICSRQYCIEFKTILELLVLLPSIFACEFPLAPYSSTLFIWRPYLQIRNMAANVLVFSRRRSHHPTDLIESPLQPAKVAIAADDASNSIEPTAVLTSDALLHAQTCLGLA